MCTGINNVFRCQQCSAVVYNLKATEGYTCYEARRHRRRGVCRTGIDYSHYDRVSEEYCLFCEIFLGGEISGLTAEICDEADEWQEDIEDGISLGQALAEHCWVEDRDTLQNHMNKAEHEDAEDIGRQGEEEDDGDNDDDKDDDDDEGGAKLY
ncbi:hypothetical protein F4782DRAFT_525986 [Xylaria castorea]|nr:hypothetical protein F4782DRAFT_525986 [Xylaria castorea]